MADIRMHKRVKDFFSRSPNYIAQSLFSFPFPLSLRGRAGKREEMGKVKGREEKGGREGRSDGRKE